MALERDSNNPVTLSNVGLVYRKLENFEKAVQYFTKEIQALTQNQKEVKSYSSRAYCYVRMSMYLEAIQDYTMALKSDPKNLHYLHNRGICYKKIHEYKKAIEDFT